MITAEQKEMVKATVPYLKENGVALTQHFYKRLFEFNPDLRNVFNIGNQQNNKQQTALARAVLAYAENTDYPEVLLPVLDGIGQKHTSLNIRAEHYLVVGEHLLDSIGEVLGDGATEELLKSWEAAYLQLAEIMSGYELELYRKQLRKKGGWTGWRPFTVKDKARESSEITSFYLYPADGGDVADFLPGQYISIRLFLPELSLLQSRKYSISTVPKGTYYRISVKKEIAAHLTPNGILNNHLHDFVNIGDLVDVSAHSGSFTLNESDHPIVFRSGGVGQTPLIATMESLITNGSERKKTWIDGCRDENVHAFRETIESWKINQDHLTRQVFYSTPGSDFSKDGHYEGWVDLKRFKSELETTSETEYYICGPAGFIEKNFRDLISLGVDRSKIYFEEFGPQTLHLN